MLIKSLFDEREQNDIFEDWYANICWDHDENRRKKVTIPVDLSAARTVEEWMVILIAIVGIFLIILAAREK